MQDFIYKPNDNGTFAVVGYKGDEADVVIPDSYGSGIITIIGDKLFSGHAEITSVRIPRSASGSERTLRISSSLSPAA